LRLLLEGARTEISSLKHLWLEAGYQGKGERWVQEVLDLSVEIVRRPPKPIPQMVARLEKLDSQWIHPMHGGSLPKKVVPNYTRALREEGFAFEGKIFGRMIPS